MIIWLIRVYFLTFSPSLFIFLRFKVCANIIKKNFKRLLTLIDASLMLTDSYLLCVLYLVPIYRLRSITSIKRFIDDLLSKFLCALSIMDSINNIKKKFVYDILKFLNSNFNDKFLTIGIIIEQLNDSWKHFYYERYTFAHISV